MKIKHLCLLVLLSLCWGNSFFFIKVALTSFSPIEIVTLRTWIGALFLFLLMMVKKTELKKWFVYWKQFWIMSCLSIVIPWTVLSYAEKITSSSLAGIINGTIPIFTMILAHVFLDHEKFSKQKLGALFLGFTGIALIFIPPLFEGILLQIGGLVLLFVNSFTSSCSIVYARKFLSNIPSNIAPFFQLIFGSITLMPFFLFSVVKDPLSTPSWQSLLCLITLGIIGTGVAFLIFFYLVKHAGASFTSTNSFLIPLVAIFSGTIFLQEKISFLTVVGTGSIFSSLLLANSSLKLESVKRCFQKKR